ncbi:hypothetical protein PSMK_08860 [Phycisphaera mikurensis NBRC 102666]|uniref:Uncharacterized protein n=1 Tax=Phycisphaera mikurensis (strain NBRC 102666 / KCTC 22515 / FYK2301M01) TaxID=1142394 RepID=I0ICQ7_PHYMF|nr:hypothetical protein PSMK_08860 [Phycisphaera mikurensis NBRC 102666]
MRRAAVGPICRPLLRPWGASPSLSCRPWLPADRPPSRGSWPRTAPIFREKIW